MKTMSSFRDFCLWFCMVWTAFESFIKSSHTLAYLLLNLCPTSRIFFVRQEVTSRRSHHVWWLSCTMPSLTWTALSVTLTRGARCFFPFMTPEKDGLSGAWEYLSSCCFQEMLKQIRELRKPRWRRLRKRLLRWCYTGRFATTIFSTTECYNVGTMLQPLETMSQQCFATLCCAKNCRCESSRATSS